MPASKLAAGLCAALCVTACDPGGPKAPIKVSATTTVGVEHAVLRDGQKIALWEKRLQGSSRQPVIVLVHGATWSGRPDFDLQIRDYSVMDAFARAGWDVFAPDIQGYGNSDEPEGESWSLASDAAQDLDAVIEWIVKQRGVEQVSLLGWSWGAQISGTYANQHSDRVKRLVLVGFKWGKGFPKREPPKDKYRVNTAKAAASDFIPGCYEQDVVDLYVRECLKFDPESPNGAYVDFLQRLPIVDPVKLAMPVMLVYGAHELDEVRMDDAMAFFGQLKHPGRSLVVLAGGGHAVLLEKPHRRWQQTVLAFFVD